MFELPAVLANLVTQFLSDRDNHAVLQTCHAATPVVHAAPRLSVFHITNLTRDMYHRYRSVCVHAGGRPWPALDLFAAIPSGDVHDICISGNETNAQSLLTHEVELQFERLPVFANVTRVDVSGWCGFRALTRFPNVRSLKIWIANVNVPVRYPALPLLKHLEIVNENEFDIHDDENEPMRLKTFPVWPSVIRIHSDFVIPPGFVNLRHVKTDDMRTIPMDLATQLWSIETSLPEHMGYGAEDNNLWCEQDESGVTVIKLDHCLSLRSFRLNSSEHGRTIIRCHDRVKITHSFGH
jgi:hypothetical protein